MLHPQGTEPLLPRGIGSRLDDSIAASLDLSRVETITEMHLKQKPGLPSQDLLTINIYDPIVHVKRKKWEMACTSKERQFLWYRAINAYEGKPTPYLPLSPGTVGGGAGGGCLPPPQPPAQRPGLGCGTFRMTTPAARAAEILIDKQRLFEQQPDVDCQHVAAGGGVEQCSRRAVPTGGIPTVFP